MTDRVAVHGRSSWPTCPAGTCVAPVRGVNISERRLLLAAWGDAVFGLAACVVLVVVLGWAILGYLAG